MKNWHDFYFLTHTAARDIMTGMNANKFFYCPISPVQQKFGLYLTGAGYETTLPGEPYPHEYHSSDYYFTWRNGRVLPDWEYQLLYIRKGRGTIEFQRGKSISVGGGDAIILRPGEWHRYRPDPKTGWSEAYIGIGGEYLERIVAPPFFSCAETIVKVPDETMFDTDIENLVEQIQSAGTEHPYTLALKAASLLASLCETPAARTGKSAHNVAMRKANLFIAHNLGDVIDFPALARRCGMGYTLFRRSFREYNGMAPLEYQNALRLRRAMHLLGNSDVPIAQIAGETGFKSPAYFSKFFHDRTGLSPLRYRLSRTG